MARPSAIALLLLLLSLLAVSQYCRATDEAGPTNHTAVVDPTELVPAEQDVLLSLPSHRQEAEPEEVKAVAKPDPDGSLPESDGEENEDKEVKRSKKHRHHHDDDGEEDEEKAGKKKKMKLSHRHHHDDDEEEKAGKKKKQKEKKMKLFHHRHHDEEKTGKPFHHADAYSDSDDEGELEEMVRQFRKAIRKRRSRHHHHHHHHAEEGGVVTWVKGLMNRF